MDNLDTLERDLEQIADCKLKIPLRETRVNVGKSDPNTRLNALREFGATQATFDRIEEMTRLDQLIWEKIRTP